MAIGKPSRLMFELALELAGCKPEDAVMVREQEETDILGAKKSGVTSVIVKTGVFSRGETKTQAEAIIDNVDDVANLI